ncbi:sporulation protein SsgA [Kitasatospora sp. NPDC001309]|uniref:sporulation protein SsgA n=1 Tax=Kitasatospora sp. NPDC001309 TaxID=3364013 RepID=UPI0036C76CB6
MSNDKHDQEHQHNEQRMTGSSTFAQIGGWLLHRSKPYLPAWVGAGAVGVAGSAASLQWQGSVGAGVALTLGSVGITAASWLVGHRLQIVHRAHVAVTTALAAAWVTAAALAGPLASGVLNTYLMGAPLVAISWNLRRLTRSGEQSATGDGNGSLLEKVGLARAKFGRIKVEANRVSAPYTLPAGEMTNADMVRSKDRLASALDVPVTAIRIQPDPDSARKGTLVVVPEDQLKVPTVWPGPSVPGGSIAELLRIGVYDDGSDLLLPLLEAIHLLVMGMTGSGKTEGALDVLLEILTRRDVVVWLSDPAKSGQDFGPIMDAFGWVALDMPSTMAMAAAVQAVIPARAKWLRDHQYRAWEEAAGRVQTDPAHSCQSGRACRCPGMPYLLVWWEEAAKTLREMGEDAFTGMAQEARSAGVSIVISMQRASGYQISTDTRASLPAALCFGVRGDDAQFALPEEVLDAGANPAAWANKRKGYVYLASAGVDEEMHSNPARTFWTGGDALYAQIGAWVVEQFAEVRAALDPVTTAAAARVAGKYFVLDQAELDAHNASVYAAAPEDARPDEEDQVDTDDAVRSAVEEMLAAAGTAAEDIPPLSAGASFDLPPVELSPEEARESLVELVEMLAGAGPGTVAVRDLYPYLEQLGRKREWVSKQMKRLSEEGVLAPTATEGTYRLVPQLAGV